MAELKATKCEHKDLRAHGRGLCQVCYKKLKKNLSPEVFNDLYPIVRKPQLLKFHAASVYEDLSSIGVTKTEVARKLGITVESLNRSIYRKKKYEEDRIVSDFIAAVDALENDSPKVRNN